MSEYIERGALLQNVGETVLFSVRGGVELPTAEMRGANKVIERIKSAPTADVVEVRHGEWGKQKRRSSWDCSICGHTVGAYIAGCANYCPNCGAKMDRKGEDNAAD